MPNPDYTEPTFAHVDPDTGAVFPSEQRVQRTLNGTLPANVPPLSPRQLTQLNKARIGYNISQLINDSADEMLAAWREVAKASPAKAIELWMELAQFTLPKLKAVSIETTDPNGLPATQLGWEELKKVVSDQ